MLTWKDPSDLTTVHEVVPIASHPMRHFYVFWSKTREQEMTLHINALKWDGQYRTTPVMEDIVEVLLKKQQTEKS
jgi:hypothetical protein